MNIYGICGSPRKAGNSEWLLQQFLDVCQKRGHSIGSLFLRETKLDLCNGTLPNEITPNTYNDDMDSIKHEMLNADALVFASPTYFDNVTPQLKNFIDRTDSFYEKLKGKKAVVFVVGQANQGSQQAAADNLKTYVEIAELQLIEAKTFQATNVGDIQKADGVQQELADIADKLFA